MRVDRSSPIPLHYQLYRQLLDQIEQGILKPGDPVPTEVELQEQLQLSRTTIRQAIIRLAHEGHIIRRQGHGSFVSRPKVQQPLHLLTSFTEDMRSRGLEPSARTIAYEKCPLPPKIARALEQPDQTVGLRIERLRLADNEPISLQVSYCSVAIGEKIRPEELEGAGSLYALLEERFGQTPAMAEETIDAVIATRPIASLLEVEVGAPLLRVERITRTPDGTPMEFVEAFYRADRYQYFARLSR